MTDLGIDDCDLVVVFLGQSDSADNTDVRSRTFQDQVFCECVALVDLKFTRDPVESKTLFKDVTEIE